MQIKLVDSNVTFSDRFLQRIISKFSLTIDKYLVKLSPEYQMAELSIQKIPRFGFRMKFNMELPFTHIYIKHDSPDLLPGIVMLRNQVKRQIRKESDKIKEKTK